LSEEEPDTRSAELGVELEDAFRKAYPELPPDRARHIARNLTQVIMGVIDIGTRAPGVGGITHMDTANALVYWCTANSRLEEVFSAKPDRAPADVQISSINAELAARVADLLICLEVLQQHPAMYDAFIRGTIALGSSGWERDRGKLEP
jgi:hypothetical protein